jgi:hypothetical protein
VLQAEPGLAGRWLLAAWGALVPITAIILPVWPFSARCEKNRSVWQAVHKGEIQI